MKSFPQTATPLKGECVCVCELACVMHVCVCVGGGRTAFLRLA